MPSFRGSKEKARHATTKISAIGESRHCQRAAGKIHSLRTRVNYEQCLAQFDAWLTETRQGDLSSATRDQAIQYLVDRSEMVKQKTLDMDRQAIQAAILGKKLPVVRSEVATVLTTRSYTDEQLKLVMAAQSARHAFSTRIARAAGLRAHELLTLLPVHERPASNHREWHADRFAGMGDVVIWTVIGKGGLRREVAIDRRLSAELDARRLDTSVLVKDRGIIYQQYYNISGGRNWSQSVSSASMRALGWSQGAHGACRHSFAQERMETLQSRGYSSECAKDVLSQELGHFRNNIVDLYLR